MRNNKKSSKIQIGHICSKCLNNILDFAGMAKKIKDWFGKIWEEKRRKGGMMKMWYKYV